MLLRNWITLRFLDARFVWLRRNHVQVGVEVVLIQEDLHVKGIAPAHAVPAVAEAAAGVEAAAGQPAEIARDEVVQTVVAGHGDEAGQIVVEKEGAVLAAEESQRGHEATAEGNIAVLLAEVKHVEAGLTATEEVQRRADPVVDILQSGVALVVTVKPSAAGRLVMERTKRVVPPVKISGVLLVMAELPREVLRMTSWQIVREVDHQALTTESAQEVVIMMMSREADLVVVM